MKTTTEDALIVAIHAMLMNWEKMSREKCFVKNADNP